MVKDHAGSRRTVLKLLATSSGAVLGGTSISGLGIADPGDLKHSLIDDLNVKNRDEEARTFQLRVYSTAGPTDRLVFSERVTTAVRELVTFQNVFPRGKTSRLEVETDDGRSATAVSTIVGTDPKRIGMEVTATPDLVAASPQHVDPGVEDFIGGGE